MTAIVTIALAFFGPILLGYGSRRFAWVPAQGLAGLHFFVSYIALPALFFRLIASTPYADFPDWSFVLTTTFATYCAFAIAFSFGALVNRGSVPEATMQGLVGASANVGVLAPGIVIAAFGSGAGAPMALVFTFDFALLAALAPLMMVLGGTERAKVRTMATDIAREVFRHPLVIATILGFLVALTRLRLPGAVDGLFAALGAAAAPAALFAFGIDLARRSLGKVEPSIVVVVGIKLIVHPLIVYLLLSWIGGFDGTWVNAAILMAALPTGATILTAAQKYGSYVERSSTAILIGSAASVVTVLGILAMLLDGTVPIDPFR